MKSLLTSICLLFLSIQALAFQVNQADTAMPKDLLAYELSIQRNEAEISYQQANKFIIISGVELVIIIVLTIFLVRKRRAK